MIWINLRLQTHLLPALLLVCRLQRAKNTVSPAPDSTHAVQMPKPRTKEPSRCVMFMLVCGRTVMLLSITSDRTMMPRASSNHRHNASSSSM